MTGTQKIKYIKFKLQNYENSNGQNNAKYKIRQSARVSQLIVRAYNNIMMIIIEITIIITLCKSLER